MKKFLFACVFILMANFLIAQEADVFVKDTTIVLTDTLAKKKKKPFFKKGHDPAKAALMSAILPGAGQVYNKKYWKVPIVYAGLGGFGVWLGFNVKDFRGYTNAYRQHVEGTDSSASYKGYNTESRLKFKREEAKSNLDISAIAFGVWYILNIVDATVDAHLFNFNINDDISISLRPDVHMKTANSLNFERDIYSGVSFKVHFK